MEADEPEFTMHPTQTASSNRILIVDDNPGIHEDFRKVLGPSASGDRGALEDAEAVLFDAAPVACSQSEFLLESAHQGEEAVQMVASAMAESRPYAVAFVDVRMPPGLDGIETILRLWQIDRRLQVVLCTAFSDYSWQEISRKLGHPENLLILKKPFDNIEVVQLAHALTNKWLVTAQVEAWMEHLDSMVMERTRELNEANCRLESTVQEARRLASLAESANRSKSDFLTLVSHEMLTPMNGIIGMADYLKGTPLNPDQSECLADILGSGERMVGMIRQVIDYVAADAPVAANPGLPIRLLPDVRKVVEGYAARAREKGIKVTIRGGEDGGVAMGDAARFRRALASLVDNAIKFSQGGEVIIEVGPASFPDQPDGRFVRCAVTDQGIGVSLERKESVFRPFVQLNESLSRDFEGMGLGLALSKKLIESANGRIGFESEAGRGSTFWLALPEAVEQRKAP